MRLTLSQIAGIAALVSALQYGQAFGQTPNILELRDAAKDAFNSTSKAFEKIEKDEANPKFQKIDRFPVFIPQQNTFGTVFNIGSCDSCHPADVTKRGTPESHKLRRPKPAAPPSGTPGF